MKLTISRVSCRAAATYAIIVRVFLGLTVDAPSIHNGAWLSALLGGALGLPWFACVSGMRDSALRNTPAMKALSALLAVFALADGASMITFAGRSAGYLALDRLPVFVLKLPLFLSMLWCVHKNGDAIGYSAMIGLRIAAALMILVAILQFDRYRPEWLAPVLGHGWREVVDGGIRSAGWIATLSGVCLIDAKAGEADDPRGVLPMPLIAGLLTAVLILSRLMMSPTLYSGSGDWLYRLDSLVTNGRAGLYLQLPMIVLLFAGLLHLLGCTGFIVAGSLQKLFPRMGGGLCALTAVAAIALLSEIPPGDLFPSRLLDQWRYPVIAALGAAVMLSQPKTYGGGASTCAH